MLPYLLLTVHDINVISYIYIADVSLCQQLFIAQMHGHTTKIHLHIFTAQHALTSLLGSDNYSLNHLQK